MVVIRTTIRPVGTHLLAEIGVNLFGGSEIAFVSHSLISIKEHFHLFCLAPAAVVESLIVVAFTVEMLTQVVVHHLVAHIGCIVFFGCHCLKDP